MHPFSYQEFLEYKEKSNCLDLFYEYLQYGGLPQTFSLEEHQKINYLDDLFNSIFYKDIVKRYPIRDIDTINIELELADMETVNKRIDRASKLAKGDKKYLAEEDAFKKIRQTLESGKPARQTDLTDEEKDLVKDAFLLTMKPILYIANVSEADIGQPDNEYVQKLKEFAKNENSDVITLCAKIEEELSVLEGDDKKEMLEAMGLEKSGLDRVINASYDLLGLMSFLTAGKKETRAWTIKKGTKAPQAAGKIHTDFERGFIKAEIVSYDDLIKNGSYQKAKEQGLVRMEGKEYVMKDGDIVEFKFNV